MSAGRPRIFYFEGNPDGTVGGSYFSLLYLVSGLDRSRYEPVVGFRRDIPFVRRFRDAGLEVQITPGHQAVALARGPFRKLIGPLQNVINVAAFFLVSIPRWALFLRRSRISLVHANNSVTRSHDLMLGALLAGIPVVTHERGINTSYSRLTRFVAGRIDAIICISGAVRRTLEAHGIRGGNLHVIFNGIDPATVRPRRTPEEIRRAHDIAPGRPILVMLGNIRRWKGQEIVVRAMGRVAARHPGAVCVFVGEATEQDRPYEQELHGLVETLGIRDNVRFAGYQEHVADYVQAAVLSIHASVLPEPFGRVLLEAMALRKPVVGSSGGAVPEIVLDGETGRTFREGDADDLAACLIDLLDRPGEAAALGDAGYERVTRVFSIRENIARTAAIYDRILAPPHRVGARARAGA